MKTYQHQTDATIFHNLSAKELVELAIDRSEAELAANGALCVRTGARTGRSPNDRFIVDDETTHETVAWGNINRPFSKAHFESLWQKAEVYIAERDQFTADLEVGADPHFKIPVHVVTETAWHNLFAHHLFITPKTPNMEPSKVWHILSVPYFHTDPKTDGTNSEAAVVINFSEQKVLICGTAYAGEMKKAMFSVLNYILPEHENLPMHCAANVDNDGHVALFFGLSGTGKTTLSADPSRLLIGDDEHGWGPQGVFNFEGGCYAKCIDLSPENEPVIWEAIRAGAIMENVVLDPNSNQPDFTDTKYTQNTRAAYPRTHIPLRIEENRAGQPNAVIFLTCDLYGVLPPVALLNKEQAAYHFLSGYTALVGSTEMGDDNSPIKTTFSTCFGAPFFPRAAKVYAQLLMKRIETANAQVYLVNTGWAGGAYGKGGKRYPIPTTRAIIHAVQRGEVKKAEQTILPGFNVAIPTSLQGIESTILDPRQSWADQGAYQAELHTLIKKFDENFGRFDVPENIRDAGPRD